VTQSPQEFREHIIDSVEAILRACEEATRPPEVDPARGDLFELFASAEARGALREDSDVDLSADGLCQALSERWGLKQAAQDSVRTQTALNAEQLARMRSLWSIMRMWMEWTYAWERWRDFPHAGSVSSAGTSERLSGKSDDAQDVV
jgi:hypothetical protein